MTLISSLVVHKVFAVALLFPGGAAHLQAVAANEPLLKPYRISRLSYASAPLTQSPTDNKSKTHAAKQVFDHAERLRTEGSSASLKKAIERYEEAVRLFRTTSDRGWEAAALNGIGVVYYALAENYKALDYFNQALPLRRAAGDRVGEAVTLNNIGLVYNIRGEQQRALDHYIQALQLWRAVADRVGEAIALNNIGILHSELGEQQQALDYLNQALVIRRTLGNHAAEANTLNNLGKVYSDLGEKTKALDYFTQTLPLWRAERNRAGEAISLINIGKVYADLDEKQKALDYYNQALPLLRAVGDRNAEANTLNNLGRIYDDLGDPQKALDYYNRALPLWREGGYRTGEAATLRNIGAIYSALGQQQKALAYYRQVLPINREVGDRAGEGTTLNNIGRVYDALGDQQKALDYYNQALPLRRAVGDRAGEGTTLNNIGVGYGTLGQQEKALDYYAQALLLSRKVGDRAGEAGTLTNLMYEWRDNNTALAVFYGKQAVNVYQQLRADISGLNQEIQKSFLRSKEDAYRTLANLLIARGRLPEAQQVLGLLKEQEYFEFVRRDASASALLQRSDLSPDEEAAVKRYNEVADQITKLSVEFSALKGGGTSPDDSHYRKLQTDIEAANRTFHVMLRQLGDEFGKDKDKGIVKELKANAALQSDLKRWGGSAVSLYTIVGADNYRVILTTPMLQVARQAEPAIKATELNDLILQFREAIQNPGVDPWPLAHRLYKILISPVEKDLEAAGAKTLVWSLDGALRYLPVAALHDGKHYFVERYQNVTVTLASRTRLSEPPSRAWRGLGFGVSKGVVKDWGVFPPLPSVPAELRGIIREENQSQRLGGVLAGRVMLDQAFTERTMERALGEGRYPLVHIASHFVFKPGNETDSFLLLGDGNRLTLDKIRITPGPFFDGVELLTLSACDTATGGEANGKEVEGFAVLAQEEGAQAVLATLWPVADESTRLWMKNFYQYRVTQPGITKVEALRQAQLALLRPRTGVTQAGIASAWAVSIGNKSPAPPFKADPKAPFAHPYFWAPFILIGNWR